VRRWVWVGAVAALLAVACRSLVPQEPSPPADTPVVVAMPSATATTTMTAARIAVQIVIFSEVRLQELDPRLQAAVLAYLDGRGWTYAGDCPEIDVVPSHRTGHCTSSFPPDNGRATIYVVGPPNPVSGPADNMVILTLEESPQGWTLIQEVEP
jgi:hypothetical protein